MSGMYMAHLPVLSHFRLRTALDPWPFPSNSKYSGSD
jgi:hypothetical protein